MTTRARRSARAADRVEALARVVVRALRGGLESGQVSLADVVDLTHAQLVRPGATVRPLSQKRREHLREALVHLATALEEPVRPRQLVEYARAAAGALLACEPTVPHPGVLIEERIHDSGALAEAAVFAEASRARDDDDLVRRAVTRALKARRRGLPGRIALDLKDDDPLKRLLDLPSDGRVLLPKTDLRARVASLAERDTTFGATLRKAARFGEDVVRPALGEELWTLGRPVGFSDQRETRVLMEAHGATAAAELGFRVAEVVERLRGIPGFGGIVGIKVVARAPVARGVVGRRAPRV